MVYFFLESRPSLKKIKKHYNLEETLKFFLKERNMGKNCLCVTVCGQKWEAELVKNELNKY